MLYFAYGSNLNHDQMRSRCPESKYIKRARLQSYQLVFDGHSIKWGGPTVNIVENPISEVWGALFDISERDRQLLDRNEGVHKNIYQPLSVNVTDDSGREYEALTYARTGQTEGKPTAEYRRQVLRGMTDCGLPEEYIHRISLLGNNNDK